MTYNWNYPTTMWVGEKRVKDLHLACNNLNIKNPLFVTDKDLISLPFVKEIISDLNRYKIDLVGFHGQQQQISFQHGPHHKIRHIARNISQAL